MADSNTPEFFTPFQRRLISIALVVLAINLIGAFFFGVFLVLRWFVLYFSAILWPLAASGILALILKPLVFHAEKYLRIGRAGSVILLYVVFILFCLTLAGLALPVIVSQAKAFILYFPNLLAEFIEFIERFLPDISVLVQGFLSGDAVAEPFRAVSKYFQETGEASIPALDTLGDVIGNVVTFGIGFVIIPVYLFFFLLSDKNPLKAIDRQLSFIPEWLREDITFLLGEFARIMVAFFRGQILIGLTMGVLMAIGFTIVDLKFAVFLGIFIGILNIIPYLGSIIGLLTVLPLAYFQDGGGLVLLLLVLGVFTIVQLIESYLLTPTIMGRSTGLHPLTIIIAIFFWGTAFGGILGMILAIPLTAFFVVVWRLVRKKYLSDNSEDNQ